MDSTERTPATAPQPADPAPTPSAAAPPLPQSSGSSVPSTPEVPPPSSSTPSSPSLNLISNPTQQAQHGPPQTQTETPQQAPPPQPQSQTIQQPQQLPQKPPSFQQPQQRTALTRSRPQQPPFPHFSQQHILPPSTSSSLPSPSFSSPSTPVQRGGLAIGLPALHPPRSQQQTTFSSFGQTPSNSQTFGGLGRGSVGPSDQNMGSSNQVRHPSPGIQTIGMLGSLNTPPQMRSSGVPGLHQQRPGQSSMRSTPSLNNQPQTTQKFQSHGLLRGQSMASPSSSLPGTPQGSQSLQQPWMTPSYRPQMKPQVLQHRPQNLQQHQQSTLTASHQHQMPSSQQLQQQQQKQLQQPQKQQLLSLSHQSVGQQSQQYTSTQKSVPSQQQPSRTHILATQKSPVPEMVQSGVNQPGSNSPVVVTDAVESDNRILSKRSIHELVSQIDPAEKLDPEVEDILMEIADDFIESITTFSCLLAKHRKSTTLEASDILLHLERNWNMTLPGFGGDEIKCYKKPIVNDIHKERLALIKKSVLGSPDLGSAKASTAGQAAANTKSHGARAPVTGSPKIT